MSFLHSHTITLEIPLPTSTAKHIQTSIYIQYTASSSSLKKCQERPQHQRALRPNWKNIKLGEVRAGTILRDGGGWKDYCMKNVQTRWVCT